MATSRTPTKKPGSSYVLTPSPSRYTFSAQRAEFTKPVPAALLPVYPKFSGDSDSGDDASVVNISTSTEPTLQGPKTGPSAEGSDQLYQDVDAMATTGQVSPVRGFAEKSGISSPNLTNPPQKTADLDRWPGSVDDMKSKPERYSNSVMARLASFLGLKRQEQPGRSLSSVIPPLTEVPFPALSSTKELKYSPLRSDSLRAASNLSANNAQDHRSTNMAVAIEDNCVPQSGSLIESEQSPTGQAQSSSATYPPPVRPTRFLRHHRSRSLNVLKTPAAHFHVSNQASSLASAQEVPPPDLRSRSMDDPSRLGPSMFMDGSSYHGPPPVSLPPNCVVVQVWAVGLDESDRQLAVGSGSCIIDEAYKFKRSQESADQQKCEEKAINYSIFKGSKLLRWSLDFGAKKKEKALPLDWLDTPGVRPPSIPDRQVTQKYSGTRAVREVSRPKSVPQGPEAGYIPGQSFVGRVLEVGSVAFAAKDDWVVGLVDTRKCGPVDEFIVIDWRQIHRVSAPNEPCPPDLPNSTSSTLISEAPSGKPTEDVTCNRDALETEGKDLLVHVVPLTFEELALLPLCGIPAYLAVKTCIDAFPDCFIVDKPVSECPYPALIQRRRALVLRGHDGVGAMAVQMLVRQGWRVSAHVPFSRVPWDATQAEADGFMLAVEDRLKKFGADEVIYDDGISYPNCQDGGMNDRKAAVVRVIETLLADGDVFDAVLDLVGGKEIREASERLLRLNGSPGAHGVGQFTTLLGDDPVDDPAGNSRSNLANRSTFTLNNLPYADEHIEVFRDTQTGDIGRSVKYTWMKSVFESEDGEIWETLDSVLRLALEDGIRPHLEEAGGEIFGRQRRVVALEKVSDVLVDGDLLSDGGMVVVHVAR